LHFESCFYTKITEILSEKSFNFNPTELINIHKRLFSGVYKHAGKIREYNFTKDKWVLNGDTIIYAPYDAIQPALQYDFEQEKMANVMENGLFCNKFPFKILINIKIGYLIPYFFL